MLRTSDLMERDPVCGATVDRLRARAVAIVAGRTFYFCCGEHRALFVQNPTHYGGPAALVVGSGSGAPQGVVPAATAAHDVAVSHGGASGLNGGAAAANGAALVNGRGGPSAAPPAERAGPAAGRPLRSAALAVVDDPGGKQSAPPVVETTRRATDLVCGMVVNKETAPAVFEHGGVRYYFCSSRCRDRFAAEPSRYVGSVPASAPQLDTTPLHGVPTHSRSYSELVIERLFLSIEGMTCASCVSRVERAIARLPGVVDATVNLATESATVEAAAKGFKPQSVVDAVAQVGYRAELRVVGSARREPASVQRLSRVRNRMLLAAGPTVLLMLGMVAMPVAGGHGESIGLRLVAAVLAAFVLFVAGRDLLRATVTQARRASVNMDTLVALGSLVAYGASLWALVQGRREVYFETAAAIVCFALVGRWLEERTRGRTGSAIAALLDLRPPTARRLGPGGAGETVIPVEDLRIGDRVRVLPGERIPVDGTLVEGEAAVDESSWTGEPLPVVRSVGSPVLAGSVVLDGAVVLEGRAVGGDTRLARIARLVEEAQGSRVPIQRLADRISAGFVWGVLGAAVAAFVFHRLGRGASTDEALLIGITTLVVACPCALGLATPAAIMVAIGRAARRGILIRNAETLERAATLQVLALDKTGTLTEGHPSVDQFLPQPGFDVGEVLRLVAIAEAGSEHPAGQAVRRFALESPSTGGVAPRSRRLNPGGTPTAAVRPERFRATPGHGVVAEVEGHTLLIGNRQLLEREEVELETVGPLLATWGGAAEAGARTVVLAALDGRLAALFSLGDRVKDGAADAVRSLHEAGISTLLLSGDRSEAVAAVARAVGITEVRAEARPEDKVAAVAAQRSRGAVVGMAGDGVNDAPALAAADVGIAMGTGADVAIEAAPITIVHGDLASIVEMVRIARQTMQTIRQNLGWALGYNAVGLVLAASGVLGHRGPMLAAAAMALSSVSVLYNSLRLDR
jgi:Cu+-exporting ATPase